MTRSPGSCPHGPLGGFLFFVCVCVFAVQTEDGVTRGREGSRQAGRLSQDRVGKCEQGCNWSSSDLCQVTSESLARSVARSVEPEFTAGLFHTLQFASFTLCFPSFPSSL